MIKDYFKKNEFKQFIFSTQDAGILHDVDYPEDLSQSKLKMTDSTKIVNFLSRITSSIFFLIIYPCAGLTSQGEGINSLLNYDLKGYVEYEHRYFPKKDRKRFANQTNQSMALSFELFLEIENHDLSLLIAPLHDRSERCV